MATVKKVTLAPARWWICTVNNPEVGAMEYFKAWMQDNNIRYIAGQTEVGEATGTRHLQFVVNFKVPVRLSGLRKKDPRGHYEVINNEDAAKKYVAKKETS